MEIIDTYSPKYIGKVEDYIPTNPPPCLVCENRDMSKNHDPCLNCQKPWNYHLYQEGKLSYDDIGKEDLEEDRVPAPQGKIGYARYAMDWEDIASELGFGSVYDMFYHFRKVRGMTQGKIREMTGRGKNAVGDQCKRFGL